MTAFSDSAVAAWALIAQADRTLLSVVGRSLAVSGLACALASVAGMALGAWLGWMAVPWIVFAASILSAVYGLACAWFKKGDMQQPMAFGPFLAVAGWGVLLLGRNFGSWA